ERPDAAVRMQPTDHLDRMFELARLALESAAFLFHRRLEIVDRFGSAAELLERDGLRTVLDDHAGAFVDLPDVVVPVDANRMRERRGVIVRSPLLDERAALIEFPQHRGRTASGDALRVCARIDEDVIL